MICLVKKMTLLSLLRNKRALLYMSVLLEFSFMVQLSSKIHFCLIDASWEKDILLSYLKLFYLFIRIFPETSSILIFLDLKYDSYL